jgi:hypothetical protein
MNSRRFIACPERADDSLTTFWRARRLDDAVRGAKVTFPASLHFSPPTTILAHIFAIASAAFQSDVMASPATPAFREILKDWVDIAQAIVTIGAVFVGGLWTYEIFIKERHDYPHANIEHKISHLSLADKGQLLRVGLDLTNTGSSLLEIDHSMIRIQQILPLLSCSANPCAANQLKDAAGAVERKEDRFDWPLIADRDVKSTTDIEPGEKQSVDYEFLIPSAVKAVRVYTYLRNDRLSTDDREIGWYASSFYDFSAPHDGGKK